MSEPAVTYRGTVYPWHCDHNGHMNVMWYVGKFDEATWSLFASIGLLPSRLRDERRGMVAVEQTLKYEREVVAGDVVVVRSSLLDVRERVLRFRHEMLLAETDVLAASTVLTGVHIDRQTRKSIPLPSDVVALATSLLADAPAVP